MPSHQTGFDRHIISVTRLRQDGGMDLEVTIDTVRRIAAARGGTGLDRTTLEAGLRDVTVLRSWLSAAEADLTRQLSQAVPFPEATLADTSSNTARKESDDEGEREPGRHARRALERDLADPRGDSRPNSPRADGRAGRARACGDRAQRRRALRPRRAQPRTHYVWPTAPMTTGPTHRNAA